MRSILIKDAQIINQGKIESGDIFIKNGRIEKIAPIIDILANIEINAHQQYAMPGIIDDQVHFREPGLTHKASIASESVAAVVGGVSSFMEMPNTIPPTLTQWELERKYQIAAATSLANYSFFMGASNDNLDEVLRTNPENVCGIKIFMGSSTGNMLVDNPKTLEAIFANSPEGKSGVPMLIATHCEDENTIKKNVEKYKQIYGDDVPVELHPIIRSVEGCYISSSLAVELAKKNNTRLHILHISTSNELSLFQSDIPLEKKRITAEVCVHHLYFNSDFYNTLGTQIKCNPAIKESTHQIALFEALLDNRLDIIATDHAPHTCNEKQQNYWNAPSGVPLVQHALNVMLEFYHQGKITLERIVEKMCHAPATCFNIKERGFLEEGNWADVVLFDVNKTWEVNKSNVYYKCAWSPFEGHTFKGKVKTTIVSGHLAYHNGNINTTKMGERLYFNR